MRTNAPIAAWVVGVSGLASLGPSLPSIAQLPPTPSSAAASSPVSPSSAVRPPVTIKCPNGRQYRLTTGSGVGACKVYVDHGRVIGGFCTDGAMRPGRPVRRAAWKSPVPALASSIVPTPPATIRRVAARFNPSSAPRSIASRVCSGTSVPLRGPAGRRTRPVRGYCRRRSARTPLGDTPRTRKRYVT
jgi:hypothetical protein